MHDMNRAVEVEPVWPRQAILLPLKLPSMHRFLHRAHLVDKKKPGAKTKFRKAGNSLCCRSESDDTIRAAFCFERKHDISARLVRLFAENTRLKMASVRVLKINLMALLQSHPIMF
jgi:hypothetical protein